jgi:hypothetical protein
MYFFSFTRQTQQFILLPSTVERRVAGDVATAAKLPTLGHRLPCSLLIFDKCFFKKTKLENNFTSFKTHKTSFEVAEQLYKSAVSSQAFSRNLCRA